MYAMLSIVTIRVYSSVISRIQLDSILLHDSSSDDMMMHQNSTFPKVSSRHDDDVVSDQLKTCICHTTVAHTSCYVVSHLLM
jgi:hypothetical protein